MTVSRNGVGRLWTWIFRCSWDFNEGAAEFEVGLMGEVGVPDSGRKGMTIPND